MAGSASAALVLAVLLTASRAGAQPASELAAPAGPAPSADEAEPRVPPPAPNGYATTARPPRGAPRPPHPSRVEPEPRRGYMPTWKLLVPGLACFVSSYGGAVTAALQVDLVYGSSSSVTGWLYAPVVGPFVLTAMADGHPEAQAIFATLGVAQTAGLALIVAGLAIDRRAGRDEDEQDPATGARVAVVPLLDPGGAGLALAGSF